MGAGHSSSSHQRLEAPDPKTCNNDEAAPKMCEVALRLCCSLLRSLLLGVSHITSQGGPDHHPLDTLHSMLGEGRLGRSIQPCTRVCTPKG
eukprot:6014817-Amphidinium_carterae.1